MNTTFDIFIYILFVFSFGVFTGASAGRDSEVHCAGIIGIAVCLIITLTRFFTINF